MADIRSDMSELSEIVKELKEIASRGKKLRARKVALVERIERWLEENDQHGIRFKELKVIRKERKIRPTLKKEEKEIAMLKVLEEHGISQSEKILEALKESGFKNEQVKTSLKVSIDVPEIF